MALNSVYDLPPVSFIDDDSIDAITSRLVSNYEARYREITGQRVSLSAADPTRILLYTIAADLYQIEQYVDRAGKQDLLRYSYGEYLDNLAAMRGVTRLPASAATATVRFTFSEPQASVLAIPAGTRVSNGMGLYYAVMEYTEAAPMSEYVDVEVLCTVTGSAGNGLTPGQICVLVDPLPYVESVSNITASESGSDVEDDASLAERTYLAPSGYSVAGPADAYTYWAKTYRAEIGDVVPVSPSPGEVTVYVLMIDGSLPTPSLLSGLRDYLSADTIRPMTDVVTVSAPEVEGLVLDLTYWINRSDKTRAESIRSAVGRAVDEYIAWQTAQIGRDVNPDKLLQLIIAAGAKRAVIRSPVFTPCSPVAVPQLTQQTITYGGLEDD